MPKHESAYLARQPHQKNRAVIRQTSRCVGRAEDGADEKASADQVTNNHLQGQQHLVAGNCSNRYTHLNRGQSSSKGKRRATVAQVVAQPHQACRRSLFANLVGLQEAEVEASGAEAAMVPLLAHHEGLQSRIQEEDIAVDAVQSESQRLAYNPNDCNKGQIAPCHMLMPTLLGRDRCKNTTSRTI